MIPATAPKNFLVLLFVQAIAGKCTTPNNEEADCVSIYKCPVLLNALATNPSASTEFVKLSKCGGESEEPLVCCGYLSSLNASEKNAASIGKCTTPNNEEADCISIYKCPVLLDALATNISASKEFIKLSKCGGESAAEPLVCCGSFSYLNASENNAPSEGDKLYSEGLLAHRRYCGYQHFDDYYHPENSRGLDEFPWLALLLFKDLTNNTVVPNIRCSGSLIGPKYVLTVAYCVTHARYNLTAVRFGEYNVDKAKDCIEGYLEECSDPTEDFDVEKVIPHPGFINTPARILNDIAIVRLSKRVVYSDYIRPICLPARGTKRPETGDVLTTSGWGRTADGTLAKIKKRISIRLITNTLCEENYKANRLPIKERNFCTVGVNDTDFSCVGDNGAPVMLSNRYQWHLEGINSFGPIPCSHKFPNVNTRVVNYLDWIERNILP